MKTMKRCVAIALAAVMMMLMMTGCGGGAAGTKYPEVLAKINQDRAKGNQSSVAEVAALDNEADKIMDLAVQYLYSGSNSDKYAIDNYVNKLKGSNVTAFPKVLRVSNVVPIISTTETYHDSSWYFKYNYELRYTRADSVGIAVKELTGKYNGVVIMIIVYAYDAPQ